MEQMLTVNQVADLLQVDAGTVREYIKQGKIKAIKLGRVWRIKTSEVSYLMGGSK